MDLVAGVCQTDFSGYPDCRDSFIDELMSVTNTGSGLEHGFRLRIHTPLMWIDKAATFQLADDLNCLEEVILLSHTCYNGNREKFNDWGYGCDECPACELRKKDLINLLTTQQHYINMYTSTKITESFSTCFRQFKSESHCKFLHGYALKFKLFLNAKHWIKNWVQDFGFLKEQAKLTSADSYHLEAMV